MIFSTTLLIIQYFTCVVIRHNIYFHSTILFLLSLWIHPYELLLSMFSYIHNWLIQMNKRGQKQISKSTIYMLPVVPFLYSYNNHSFYIPTTNRTLLTPGEFLYHKLNTTIELIVPFYNFDIKINKNKNILHLLVIIHIASQHLVSIYM